MSWPEAADALPAADVPFETPDIEVADQLPGTPMAEPYVSQPVVVSAHRCLTRAKPTHCLTGPICSAATWSSSRRRWPPPRP